MENIRELMPERVRKQWDEQDAKDAKHSEQVRQACADAIELLASAIRHPRISRVDLEEAQRKVNRALYYVALLDQEGL